VSGCTLHTETYSQVSCCSSASSYTFKKKETYSEVSWCIFASGYIVHTKRNLLLVSWDSSFQTMHVHRDLFLGILVHLYVILCTHMLYVHTHRNLLLGILCSSASGYISHTRTCSRVSGCSFFSFFSDAIQAHKTYSQESWRSSPISD
jgi:hypothetical protein